MLPGTYSLVYTYTNGTAESAPSPESAPFVVTTSAGGTSNIPRLRLPALPAGMTGFNIYVTQPNGPSGGEVIRYASNAHPKVYNLTAAIPAGTAESAGLRDRGPRRHHRR